MRRPPKITTLILSEVEGWAKQRQAGLTSPGLSFDFAQDEPVERLREVAAQGG